MTCVLTELAREPSIVNYFLIMVTSGADGGI